MSADPRAALDRFVVALERHLEASSSRRGEDDPVVLAAYDELADAFEAYDTALFDAFDETTPLEVYDDDDDSDDDDDDDDVDGHDDEDGDDTRLYSGLDDDLDVDDDES